MLFEDFLHQEFEQEMINENHGYDKDDAAEVFETWASELSTLDWIELGEKAIKKAITLNQNG